MYASLTEFSIIGVQAHYFLRGLSKCGYLADYASFLYAEHISVAAKDVRYRG